MDNQCRFEPISKHCLSLDCHYKLDRLAMCLKNFRNASQLLPFTATIPALEWTTNAGINLF